MTTGNLISAISLGEKLSVQYVNPKDLKVFDYSRNLFPELQGEAYQFLKNDIIENGIRTPLEVTKEYLILCGHERHRVALEIGLKEVPVIFYSDAEVANQKIRCIKDNLARKAVDVRTKVRCYGELREIYGLKRGDLGKVQREKGQSGFSAVNQSSEGFTFMSHADMAKEVGFSEVTMERALKIEKSNLPEQIKQATFQGKIGIETTYNFSRESKEIQEKAIPKIIEEIESGKERIYLQDILNDVKDSTGKPSQNMREFLSTYKQALDKVEEIDTTSEDVKIAISFFKKLLDEKQVTCPTCGEKHLQWRCGHDF
jgi:hypothetical protein